MIRAATTADLTRIAEIHVAAWHHAYPDILSQEILEKATVRARLIKWEQCFQAGNHEVYVLTDGDQIAGFCRLCAARPVASPPPDYGELTHLYLDPAHISKGRGQHLFTFAQHRLQEQDYAGMLLWTLEQNTRARRFYERQGMQFDGTRQDDPAWLGEGVYEVRYVFPFTH